MYQDVVVACQSVWEERTYAAKATNVARTTQLGAAPATMAKMEEENKETLNAKRRPITSAPRKAIQYVSPSHST